MLTVKNPEKFDWASIPLDECLHGNAMDTRMTMKIYKELLELLKETDRENLFSKLLSPALEYFADFEYKGVDIDEQALQTQDKDILNRLDEIEKEFKFLSKDEKINIASGRQLINLFFEDPEGLQLFPIRKTDKGSPCLNAETLTEMLTEITIEILNRNESTKSISN